MEFLDEYDSRPRILLQSKHLPQRIDSDQAFHRSSFSSLHRPTLFVSLGSSILILILALLYFHSEPLKSILLWFSLSLIIGPFAPPSLTAGDIRIGIGPLLKESPKIDVETDEKSSRKTTKIRKKAFQDAIRVDGLFAKIEPVGGLSADLTENQSNSNTGFPTEMKSDDQKEWRWSEVDEEVLKKLIGKHPVGKPGRWEDIAKGFNGRVKVETVIQKAKEMGERKTSDQDSYKKFLKDRKPMDKRALEEGSNDVIEIENNHNVDEGRKENDGWSATEDLALLNALKAFPKNTPMRWEKVTASLPGKTKSACMKRVSELKKDFRSSKGSSGQTS